MTPSHRAPQRPCGWCDGGLIYHGTDRETECSSCGGTSEVTDLLAALEQSIKEARRG